MPIFTLRSQALQKSIKEQTEINLSPVKSLEGERSVILAFYAGAQNAHVGQIWRPRETDIVAWYWNPYLIYTYFLAYLCAFSGLAQAHFFAIIFEQL